MFRLPLFPLPVVLFPGAQLPLHIFEPRYRRMVARCLEYDRRFGLIFHDPDRLGPFLAEPGRVGCIAHIEHFQILPDGRSLLVARGVDRFRIVDGLESGEPFYEAVAEPVEDASRAGEEEIEFRRRRSLALFRRVVATLPGGRRRAPQWQTDEELSFRLAPTIRMDPLWHQSLLESLDEYDRLDRLDAVLEVALGAGE